MYKVINNRRYNTETAKKLGYWESDQDYRGLYHEEEILYRNKYGCLPVLDGDNKLVGIITEADFLRLAIALLHDA